MDALPPSPDEPEIGSEQDQEVEFGKAWDRGLELHSVVERLPGELVLKSGLSATRKRLLESWSKIEGPGLDGVLPEGALETLNGWIHDAEISISYIVKIGRDSRRAKSASPDGRTYVVPLVDPDDLPQVIETIDEADWIDDEWCWPWSEKPAIEKSKKGWDKGKLIKVGVIGAIGAMAIIAYLDEEN